MSSSNSPCAACKLLRRKCTQGCVFAPYFPPDQPTKFANVHKVFGASNVTKLLNDLPQSQREDAVNSLAYEAEARIRDPVYGCVAYISLLQIKIREVREQINAARKELATYVGPATGGYAPIVNPHHHPAAAAAAAQYQNAQAQYAAGMGLGVGVVPYAQAMAMQHQVPTHHQHEQIIMNAQNRAAAVEVARGQEMMMRNPAAYAHGTVAGVGATVTVVPQGSADAASYDGVQFLLPHQHAQSADTAVAMTYRMERSPPPQSSGQSHSHLEAAHTRQQHHTDGSDEGSEGATPPA